MTSLLAASLACRPASVEPTCPEPQVAAQDPPPVRAAEAEPERLRTSHDLVEVDVVGVGAEGTGAVVLLQERNGARRIVPIFIGLTEGRAIDQRLRGEKFIRPLTHDLLESILAERKLTVERIEIDDLEEGTFLGRLYLADGDGRVSRLDARPSDCIALAVGAGAPIFMAVGVVDSTGIPPEMVEDPQPAAEPAR